MMERFTNFLGKIALGLLIAGVSAAIGQTVSPPGGGGCSNNCTFTGNTTVTNILGTQFQVDTNNYFTKEASNTITQVSGGQSYLISGAGAGAGFNDGSFSGLGFRQWQGVPVALFGTDAGVGNSDRAGDPLVIYSGWGTGAGTSSYVLLKSSVAGASSTNHQATADGLKIINGQAVTTAYTVSTLPTGVKGGRAHVTDATVCTFLGALTGGGSAFCPVVFNGSAWVGG